MLATSKPGLFELTPTEAFRQGTALATAVRYSPEETRMAVVRAVAETVEFIDAKKTLSTPEQIIFTAEAILRNNPSTTLEELRLTLDGMKTGKYGKFYERLKTQEFLDCLNRNEADRAEILERINEERKVTRGADDPNNITYQPKTIEDLRRERNAPIFALAKHIADNNKQTDQ